MSTDAKLKHAKKQRKTQDTPKTNLFDECI